MPKVSISLLLYNGRQFLPDCLASLERQTYPDLEVIIIDNASADGGADWVRAHYSTFKLLIQPTNLGFCAGHNLGFSLATGKYIFCLNQDIILEPDFIQNIITFMEEHPRVAAASGQLRRWDFAHHQKTDFIDSLGLLVYRNGQVADWKQGAPALDLPSTPTEVFGLSGAACIYRRAALDDVVIPPLHHAPSDTPPYFDPDFFAYKEDIDLACRLRLRGWQAYLVPQSIGYHARSVSRTTSLFKNRRQKSPFANYHSYRNHLFYLLKNIPARQWLIDGPRLVFYEFAKFGYILLREPKTLTALVDVIRQCGKMLAKRRWIQKHRQVAFSAWHCWFK